MEGIFCLPSILSLLMAWNLYYGLCKVRGGPMHEDFLSVPHIASGRDIVVEYGDEEGKEMQPIIFEFCVFLLFQHFVRKQISFS